MVERKLTEADMLDLLRRRHVRPGNGGAGEYAFMTHVRNSAGFQSNRTFDAVTMSLWPSRGLTLHAFEVKVSRSDWLRELKEPAKAEAAARCCDRFSLVVSDEAIVAEGELPVTWGLLVVRRGKLVCAKDAPLLPGADPKRGVRRDFLVALLRSAGAVPEVDPAHIAAAREEGRREAEEAHTRTIEVWREDRDALRKQIADFQKESGVALARWHGDRDAATVGRALRVVLEGERRAAAQIQQIERAHERLIDAAKALEPFLSEEAVADAV